MHPNRTALVVLVIALIAGAPGVSPAQIQKQKPTREFMRQKLNYSQGILEGLTLEKYDLVVTNAVLLRNMNVTNAFLALNNPIYRGHISNFQANMDGLARMAKDKNLEGATDAYARVAKNCVQCHQQFRREQFVGHQK